MKGKKLIDNVQKILGLALIGVFITYVIGELFLPYPDPTDRRTREVMNAEWVGIQADGTRMPIEIPGTIEAERGEQVAIETVLPEDQEHSWCFIRGMQQDYRIYVDDELRKEYTTEDTRIVGKTSANAYIFFELHESDAGKTLRLEHVSDSSYTGWFGTIYTGEKYELIRLLIGRYAFRAMLAVVMFVLAALATGYGLLNRFKHHENQELVFVGLAVMICAAWLLVESQLRQFFMTNSTMATSIGFYLVLLLPFPFLAYLNCLQKSRYEKGYTILTVGVLINFVFTTFMQMMGIKDFFEIMMTSHVMIVATCLYGIVTIILDIKRKYIRDYINVAIGFCVVAVSGFVEIILVYKNSEVENGVCLSFGLLFLLGTAVSRIIKVILQNEKEKEAAVIASQTKMQFLANMSHEVRTPINSIIGMNEMVLRCNSDPETREYATNIQSASRLLLGLVNDILDFSKIDAGKLDIIEVDYHLPTMLSDVLQGNQEKAKQKGLELTLNVDDALPVRLRGDDIRIRQVINNLVSNAIKYTEKGSVEILVDSVDKNKSFHLRVRVSDTGIGIKKEDIDKLFDAFQRMETKRNRNVEGAGLGLSITKQLVEQMKGTIQVESEYGKGSIFIIEIPQQIIDATAMGEFEEAYAKTFEEQVNTSAQLFIPNARILAVDDNKMNLEVIQALLKDSEIEVEVATSGQECLELCRQNCYDLILMDHMMPGIDGIETFHRLKEDKESLNQNTDVIALTAIAIAGASELYLKEGFADYLSKPFFPEELEELMKKYLVVGKQPQVSDAELGTNEQTSDKTEQTPIYATVEELLVIDKEQGIRYCADNEALYLSMLDMYCEQALEYIEAMKRHRENKEWKEYATIAHSIKSTSITLGITQFAELAKQHEFAGKDNNEAFIQKELEFFLEAYQALTDKIQKILE